MVENNDITDDRIDDLSGLREMPDDISPENLVFLRGLIDSFNASTGKLREAYSALREKVEHLNLQLEEKNRDLSASLIEKDRLSNYLTNILESLTSGVLVIDIEGKITLFNRGAESITGVTVDGALGKPYRDVMGKEAPDELTPLWTLATGEEHSQFEKTIVSPSGHKTPVGCSVSPLSNTSGTMIGAVEIFMDLSHMKALEDELARQEKLAALGQMAATMAHKIRNPLGGIAGFAGLLNLELGGNENGRRLVGKITEGVDKLERIVTSLLSYTAPLALDIHMSDLVEVMLDVASAVTSVRESVTVSVGNEEEAVYAEIDSGRFREAVMKIVDNAAEAIEGEGTISVSILADTVSSRSVDTLAGEVIDAIGQSSALARSPVPCVTVIVADTGAGMDEQTQKQLFVPFFTTRENGIGLGLAHARKIIEAHGGEIHIVSHEGRGTAVGIVFPKKRL